MTGQDTTLPGPSEERLGSPAAGSFAIRWVFPSDDGATTAINAGVNLLGRDADCGGHLPSASVSRKHAEIRWHCGGIPMLRDNDSRNGVFLNGRPVRQAPLKAGDVIRLGDWIGVLLSFTGTALLPWRFEEFTAGYWAGPTMLRHLEPARRAAPSDLSVIVQGATGSGKEGVARAIHEWSGRSGRFVALNCAAVPEALAEAELFGHRKGAFTSADRSSTGLLRAADGGTLFLDEIADLPLPVQAKLLRAIELGQVVPLGESQSVPIDIRVVAATQDSLRQAVVDKRFRGDFLARIEGLTVVLPPLRERADEVPFLLSKLIEKRRGGSGSFSFDPLLIERLCVYDWPFNVREMTQLVRRLVALYPDAATFDHDMVTSFAERSIWTERPALESSDEVAAPTSDRLMEALRDSNGNVRKAASMLAISRGRFYRLMEKMGVVVDLKGLRRGDDSSAISRS